MATDETENSERERKDVEREEEGEDTREGNGEKEGERSDCKGEVQERSWLIWGQVSTVDHLKKEV